MSCTNNLKQMSLAVHNYHDVHNSFPLTITYLPGVQKNKPENTSSRWDGSLHVALLPFLEQDALFQATQTENKKPTWDIADIKSVWITNVPAFLCPSDGGSALHGAVNYRASMGDWADIPFFNETITPEDELLSLLGDGAANENKRAPFPFHPFAVKSFSSVDDGLSNTIAFSERLIGLCGDASDARVGTLRDTNAVKVNLNQLIPGNLIAKAPGGRFDTGIYPIVQEDVSTLPNNQYISADGGAKWGCGRARYTAFSTILPPNGPAGCNGNSPSRHLIAPSSNHSGGVVVSRLDGAVDFVSEAVDCGVENWSKKLNQNTGESLYGVWGAMGSISNGESKSL